MCCNMILTCVSFLNYRGTADLWLARQPGSADLFAQYLDRYLQDREMECELENDGARNGERESLAPAITARSSLARE